MLQFKDALTEARVGIDTVPLEAEIAERRISLTSVFGGGLWTASVERVRTKNQFTKPNMKVVRATASTPIQTVADLIAKLNATEQF